MTKIGKEIFDFIWRASIVVIVGLIMAFSILIAVDTTQHIVSDSAASEDYFTAGSDQWEGPHDGEDEE